jgi:photosystem II stability/assembly factor-like uncharacterized protein
MGIRKEPAGERAERKRKMNLRKVLSCCAILLLVPCILIAGWLPLNSGMAADVNGIWFLPDGQTGYVVGQARVWKTTDGGVAWDTLILQGAVEAVTFPVNAETGFAVASGGRFYRTVNAGASWQIETTGVRHDMRGVCFPRNNRTGYIVGGDTSGVILKTTDVGRHWVRQTVNDTQPIQGVSFPEDTLTGYAAGWSGVIHKTTNGGTTWQDQVSPPAPDLMGFAFPYGMDTGFVVGAFGAILKTTNGGADWVRQTTGTSNYLTSASFPTGAETGYAVGASGTILKTTDGGSNWLRESSGVSEFLNSVCFPANYLVGYAAGRNGVLLKTTDGGAWIADPGAEVAVGAQSSRAEAWPNPFTTLTLIRYESRAGRPALAEIYNISGTLVGHLVLPGRAGEGVPWDGRDRLGRSLPDGIYLLKAASGNSVLLRIVKTS